MGERDSSGDKADKATETLLPPPSTLRKPLVGESEAVTVTVPLLLPLEGDTVYPVGGVTVQATLEVTFKVPEAPGARLRTVGSTLRLGTVFSPPPLLHDKANKQEKKAATNNPLKFRDSKLRIMFT